MKLSWRYIATKTCNIHEGDDERVEISEEEDVTDKQAHFIYHEKVKSDLK